MQFSYYYFSDVLKKKRINKKKLLFYLHVDIKYTYTHGLLPFQTKSCSGKNVHLFFVTLKLIRLKKKKSREVKHPLNALLVYNNITCYSERRSQWKVASVNFVFLLLVVFFSYWHFTTVYFSYYYISNKYYYYGHVISMPAASGCTSIKFFFLLRLFPSSTMLRWIFL